MMSCRDIPEAPPVIIATLFSTCIVNEFVCGSVFLMRGNEEKEKRKRDAEMRVHLFMSFSSPVRSPS